MQKNKIIKLFVPGRLCLFGEHSDWAGLHRIINADIVPGSAIVTGIEQGIYATAEINENFIIYNESNELKDIWVDFECAMQTMDLRNVAESDSYFSYASGVASYIKDHFTIGGVKITITKMTLPVKKGLSSSAAICVLVARAFNKLYNLNLNIRGEMDIAFKGEQRTRSRCGRLDQACAYGTVPVHMLFNGDDISTERLVVKGNFYWVFADLNSKKNTIKILNDLNKCFPFAETEKERQVHTALGSLNQNIIIKAIDYLKNGNAEELGKLMTKAQSIFDTMVAPACPSELTAPILHNFLQDENIKKLTFGGKGVGSQGDGTVQFLAKNEHAQKELIEYLLNKGLTPYKFTIKTQHRIRKAIIPVAGFGTRLYPSTRRIKKEMFPLLDKDGLVKPAILILLEQLSEAGIEDICIIVGNKEEIKYYQDFFYSPLVSEHLEKLSAQHINYEQTIKDIGEKLHFRIQSDRLGFGHAVYQAADFALGDPVLLLLGDQIYYSSKKKNCTQQLIEIYEELDKPLIAIHKIPKEQVCNYGIISGNWIDNLKTKMLITTFNEKPAISSAIDTLGEYYSIFGQYILPSDIFNVLKNEIDIHNNKNKEIDMTCVLNYYIGKGLTGIVLDGTMYDIGNPLNYKRHIIY